MSNTKAIYPTIWDQTGDQRPVIMPLLRGLWRGMMKMAEAQCRAQAGRGYLPYV
ncbi:hypothetical protein [uncultured Halomonas sp.]|uniref:hypothetical protein n=1 Tax=Halomonas mongoliensis TaxID=321265 RepID=UPI00261D6BCD|nr:hypothetical protein [uncultured Halomonas sp.]